MTKTRFAKTVVSVAIASMIVLSSVISMLALCADFVDPPATWRVIARLNAILMASRSLA